MSEMIVFANEPMNREESPNFNDDNAGVDLAESVNCVPDITNSNSNLKVDQVDEDEEIIDILGIDSPEPMPSSDFNNFEAYFEENDKTAAQSKASPVEGNKASAETSRSSSPIFDFSAWAPPPRQAAKAAMSKINSHDYQASTSVKVTPKAVKTTNVEKPCKIAKASTPSSVKVKPSVSAVPPPSAPEASTHNDDEEATELPESDVDKKKRKVPHRQTRTAKSVGFYNERFDCLQRRHKATKGATLDMEDAISEGIELVEQVLDGSSTIYKLFDTYKNACTAFKRASATLRQTILLERKLASEVWGDNVVATFRDGVFTIDKTAIDACLNRPAAPPTFKTERHHTKRLSKPVERYAPSPDTSVSDKRKRVSKAADTAVSVLPPGRSRRKVVPVAESQPPVKKLKLRSSNVSSSPHPQRVPTPVPPPKLSQTPKPSQQPPLPPPLPPPSKPGKRPPLPKFKFIEDNIITRDALRHVKENAVISCMCSTDDNGIRCLDNCVNRLLHVECGSRCIGCQNKRFTNKQYAGFEPFFTGTKGWGIRATEPIRPGQFIVEYLGEVVDEQERDRRLVQYTRNNHKHHYMMAITGAVIDATSFGNYSRFVNHSCDPNAETQKWVAQKMSRVGFFALKHIAVGEEIVFDYDFETLGEAAQPCFCGAKNCLGFIGTKKKALAATGGDMDDDDGVSDDDENSDAEDDEMEPATMPTPKPKKRKLTEQERDFRKRVAKMRKKLLKLKRIMRTVIGRKKVFLEDDIRVFNRNMFAIQDQEVRFLLLNYLMTITDDTWMTWFVEAQGIGIMYTWIVDNLASGKSLRSVLRFNVRLLEFLQRLPIINPIVFNKVNFLDLLKKILVIELPEETIIAETLNDLTEKIIRDIGDEPPIVDEDLARLVKRDGISVLDLHAELLQRSKDLLDKWSRIEPPPEQPPPEVEPVVNTKDYGADEFGSLYPLRAHTPDSPIPVSPANEFSEPECDTRASFSKSYGGVEAEERRSRRRSWSRSNDRSHHSHHSRGFSTYRRHRSRSRSCERSRYNDHRRRYDNDRSSGRIRYSRYRSRSRSPIRIRDDRRDRSHYRGHYHQRDRRRTSDERRYRRDRSRSPRRHSRSRYTSPRPSSSARDNAKLKEVKSEPVEHSTHSVSSKHSDDSPQIVPEPITPVLPQSQTSKLDVFNVFEQPSSSIASKGPLLIHINGVTSANASAAVTPMSNVSSGNLPGTGPKWLSTVQNVGYVKPTTTAPVMVPPPVNSYTYSSEEVYNASVSNYYSDHSLSFYQASIFQPPPPPEPEEESPVKVEVMDPSPSSVVSDPMHRSLDEEAGEEDSFVEDEKNKIYQPNPDWIETFTDDGIVYYYHRETRESMWTEPPPKVAEKPLAVVEMSESHSASVSAATTSSSETSESQSLRNGVKVDVNAELTETSHSSSDPHHHVRHKSSRRYHELPDNITELKTVFKREVWQHVFPYLKSRPGVAIFEDNVLVQYARKMTHYTLDNELNTGNVHLKLSKEVFSKARRYVDRGLPGFLKSHGNIEAL